MRRALAEAARRKKENVSEFIVKIDNDTLKEMHSRVRNFRKSKLTDAEVVREYLVPAWFERNVEQALYKKSLIEVSSIEIELEGVSEYIASLRGE